MTVVDTRIEMDKIVRLWFNYENHKTCWRIRIGSYYAYTVDISDNHPVQTKSISLLMLHISFAQSKRAALPKAIPPLSFSTRLALGINTYHFVNPMCL